MEETWEGIFRFETKDLPYQHYRQLAVCGLPRTDKDRLRVWAEGERLSQQELKRAREEGSVARFGRQRRILNVGASDIYPTTLPELGVEASVAQKSCSRLVQLFSPSRPHARG
jgi:hypothetical protein